MNMTNIKTWTLTEGEEQEVPLPHEGIYLKNVANYNTALIICNKINYSLEPYHTLIIYLTPVFEHAIDFRIARQAFYHSVK